MEFKDKAHKEVDRFRTRTDADHDGRVSGAEARGRAEREIAKRPWRAVAIVVGLTVIAVVAFLLIAH